MVWFLIVACFKCFLCVYVIHSINFPDNASHTIMYFANIYMVADSLVWTITVCLRQVGARNESHFVNYCIMRSNVKYIALFLTRKMKSVCLDRWKIKVKSLFIVHSMSISINSNSWECDITHLTWYQWLNINDSFLQVFSKQRFFKEKNTACATFPLNDYSSSVRRRIARNALWLLSNLPL